MVRYAFSREPMRGCFRLGYMLVSFPPLLMLVRRFALRRCLALLVLLTLLSTALLSTPGCGKPPEADNTVGKRVLTFAVSEGLDSLDPSGATAMVDFRIINALFKGLLEINPETMEVRGCVAESWDVSDDGLIYTFTLRDDVLWSNGDKLTAEDFWYGWFRAILPDEAQQYGSLFDAIEGVTAFREWREAQRQAFASGDDPRAFYEEALIHFREHVGILAEDLTLTVTLQQPTDYFLDLCAFATFSPIHEASAAKFRTFSDADGSVEIKKDYFIDAENLVCNGAYTLKSCLMNQMIELQARETYWNHSRVGNDFVTMLVIAENGSQLSRYDSGEIDWIPSFNAANAAMLPLVEQADAGQRDDVHSVYSAGTYFYLFNCLPEVNGLENPFADPSIRRAFALCVNRQFIVDRVTQIHQPVAASLIPPGAIKGYEPAIDESLLAGDLESRYDQARQLLESRYPGGVGFPGLDLLLNSGGEHGATAENLRRDWIEQLGVTMELEIVSWAQVLERHDNGNFFITRGGWFGDYEDPTTWLELFQTGNGNNNARYSNPEYDALLEAAKVDNDPVHRMETLRQAEEILMRDMPLMPIYHYRTFDLFDPNKVRNIYMNPWNKQPLELIEVDPSPTD